MKNTFLDVSLDDKLVDPHSTQSIFALYTDRKNVQTAVKALKKNGFRSSDVSLLAPNKNGGHDYVYRQTSSIIQGSIIGSIIGVIVLGLAGFLFGGRENITNAYSFNPFGTEYSVMYGFVFSFVGLIFGAAAGALVGIGSPKTAAKRYGFYLKEGGTVLVVQLVCESDKNVVTRILEKTSGHDINIMDDSKIWSTIIPEKKKLVINLELEDVKINE